MAKRMGHGGGERMYDWCVLLGLNPVPWQFDMLQRMEQQAIDETSKGGRWPLAALGDN